MTDVISPDHEADGATPTSTTRHWWTAVMYVAAVAMLLRFYDLPLKPLHHDEGVNGLFLTALVRPPHAYRYDPANYHGPTLYYAAWLSTTLFASPTFAIRFVTGVAGWLSVLLMLTFRRWLGIAGALAAATLLAVSPGGVYFSRYFIHEALLVCSTLAVVAAAVRWLDSRRPVFFYLAAIAAGLAWATKETAIITAAVLAVAAVGAVWVVATPAGESGAAAPSRWRIASVRQAVTRCLDPHRRGRRQLLDWGLALALFCVVNLVFYTSLFTHPAGALDALRSLAPWMNAGTSTHTHPWHTYLVWLAQEEFPLLLLGSAGAGLALWTADQRFAVFAGLWALGMTIAYSAIPYKTPWLTLNMVAPLAITSGYAADLAWRHRATLRQSALAAAAVVLLGLATYQAVVLSFFHYDDERYAYVYVHTDRDLLALVDRIDRLRDANGPLSIAVTSESHFPLSWYLRDYAAGFYGRPFETNHAVVVGSVRQHDELVPSLADRYVNLGPYRLRPGVDLELYARRDLKGLEPARRPRVTVAR